MPREYNLKHRDALLADIARGLISHLRERVGSIRVRLFVDRHEVKEILGLDAALRIIVDDLYWDDEGNWSDANRAEVDTY